MFSTTYILMDNLDHLYIPIYTVLYCLPNILTIGFTPTTTVIPSVLATPTVTSPSTDRSSSG